MDSPGYITNAQSSSNHLLQRVLILVKDPGVNQQSQFQRRDFFQLHLYEAVLHKVSFQLHKVMKLYEKYSFCLYWAIWFGSSYRKGK